MATNNLKTTYVDDVLNTDVNANRRYQMVTNDDGTVSFIDVTTYTTQGDTFAALDINSTNTVANEALGTRLTYAEYQALTEEEKKTGRYLITDAETDAVSASGILYDDTLTQLGATTVQGAIEKENTKLSEKASQTDFTNLKNSMVSIYKYATTSRTTTYSLLDSVTIPANSVFSVTVRGIYTATRPTGIVISEKNDSTCADYNLLASGTMICNYSGYTSSSLTLYCFGKWTSAGSNMHVIHGWYRILPS